MRSTGLAAAGSLATSARVDGKIVVSTIADPESWGDLIARASFPHLPQSWAYGEGKRAQGWDVVRATFSHGGRIVAFATVLERRLVGVRLVTRVNRGPLFLDTPTPELASAVHAALRRRWRGPLLIAPALPAGDASDMALRQAGFLLRQRQSWMSGRIDLTRTEADLWSGLASTFRNRVRNAVKAGAELRIADDPDSYEWMLARHVGNMREKGFSAADATLLRAMRAAAPEDVMVVQLIREGEPVAGMSVVRFGTHAEYHVGWFGAEGRKLNAGNFLMWETMRELQRRGVATFDVGGMRPGDGYTRFKRTMNPVEFQLAGEWVSLW